MHTKPYSVRFVCMGNIFRSPTAHGVFQQKVRAAGIDHRVWVDFAGTHNFHTGVRLTSVHRNTPGEEAMTSRS